MVGQLRVKPRKARGAECSGLRPLHAPLLDLYEQAEPSKKGYVVRLLSLWERRFPELCATGPSLSARLSRLRKLKTSPLETSREHNHTHEASQEGTSTSCL